MTVGPLLNWFAIGMSTLWVLGLGTMLAGLGFRYAPGKSAQSGQWLLWGFALFCLGWSGSVAHHWERLAWVALSALSIVLALWTGWYRARQQHT